MATQLKKFWKFVTTYDLLKLGKPGEIAETGAEVTKFALEFGLAIGLLSAAATPAGIAVAGLSGVGLAIRGVRLYRDKTGKEPTLEEWVAIAFPLAYLESLNEWVQSNDLLRQIGDTSISEAVKQESEKLGRFELDEHLARNALTCFHYSELAQALNQLLSTQLQQAGMAQNEAQLVTAWVAWGTQRYLKKALEDAGDSIRQIAELYAAGRGHKPDKLTFLAGADLSGADLSGANLNGADLSGVSLSGANLSGAELHGSFLCDGADLSYTVLISADLSRADLIGAGLIDADLSNANLDNIFWDEDTNWEDVRGLETAKYVPEALKQYLELE